MLLARAGRLGGMKVASASNADEKPATGAAKAAAAAKLPAKPAASRGSRGKARKPIYVDSDRSVFLPLNLRSPAL